MGLVNTVVPLADLERETVKWCREMLALSPFALRLMKASGRPSSAGSPAAPDRRLRPPRRAMAEACAGATARSAKRTSNDAERSSRLRSAIGSPGPFPAPALPDMVLP
jgi:hypothetical protein